MHRRARPGSPIPDGRWRGSRGEPERGNRVGDYAEGGGGSLPPFAFGLRRRVGFFVGAGALEAVSDSEGSGGAVSEAGALAGGGAAGGVAGAGATGAGGGEGGEAVGAAGAGAGGVAGDGAGAVGGIEGWCTGGAGARGTIGVNSPGRQVCGIRRIDGSLRNRSAWPHARQIRVPSESSPRDRREREPPPRLPVLRSFAQTKSVPPQLLQTGATRVTLAAASGGPSVKTVTEAPEPGPGATSTVPPEGPSSRPSVHPR